MRIILLFYYAVQKYCYATKLAVEKALNHKSKSDESVLHIEVFFHNVAGLLLYTKA